MNGPSGGWPEPREPWLHSLTATWWEAIGS